MPRSTLIAAAVGFTLLQVCITLTVVQLSIGSRDTRIDMANDNIADLAGRVTTAETNIREIVQGVNNFLSKQSPTTSQETAQ